MPSPASALMLLIGIYAVFFDPSSSTDTGTFGSYETQSQAELPHCSNNVLMEGRLEEMNDDGESQLSGNGRMNLTSTAQFYMSLKETTCLLMKSNRTLYNGFQMSLSFLHTIDFLRLEHHYAIKGKYRFGLPLIAQRCKCDCSGGDSICSLEQYQYRNCSSGAVCYRTYQPSQSNTGCVMTSTKSELCCEIQIDPYREWLFEALSLKQPDTVLVLRYRIFERSQSYSPIRHESAARRWKKSVDEVIEIPMNAGISKFALNRENLIQLVAGSGRPHRQVEPGMYFQQINHAGSDNAGPISRNKLRSGVALNDLKESSLEKLGWLRYIDGRWQVRKGLVKVTQAQHINVHDCKAQKYTSTFNAEQFVLRSDDEDIVNYDLGHLVHEEAWVAGVEVGERFVRIEHAEGSGLMLSVRTESTPRIIHHSSQFAGFNGSIQQDVESNRYLNLTFHDARGTLIGQVYSSDSRTAMDMVFSVQTSDYSTPSRYSQYNKSSRHLIRSAYNTIIAIPATIQSRRLVCVHPASDYEGEICQWLPFVDTPMQEFRVGPERWQQGHSDCQGCNERGVESLLISLDPRNWLDGLNTPTEFFTCALEVVLSACVILATVIIFTKCVIPLARCLRWSAASPPAKK